MSSFGKLYRLLKQGLDNAFKREIANSKEICCTVNKLIEEYIATHAIASIVYVDTCADLPPANLHTDELWGVNNDTGTKWIPSWLGGSYCPHGFYKSDGVSWVYFSAFPNQLTQAEVDAGIRDDGFVSAKTLKNAAQWDTKNNSVQFKDEGVNLGTSGTVTSMDFTGTYVTATRVADALTVNISTPPSSYNIVTLTFADSPYTVVPTSDLYIYLVNASLGQVDINLPTAVGNTAEYEFKKIDSSLNKVVVNAFGGEFIDGTADKTILFQNTAFAIVSDNSNFYRVA